jgi:hypothetical protein
MKFMVYVLIVCVILTSSFAAAKEINCYSPVNSSWYVVENTTCEFKVFNVQDLTTLASNFDRTDCALVNYYCSGVDINKDGVVNGSDLRLFTPSLCVENCSVVSICGNGVCSASESCSSCSADCGACPVPAPTPRRSSGGSGGSVSLIVENSSNVSANTTVENIVALEPIPEESVITGTLPEEDLGNVVTEGNTSPNSKGNELTGFATSETDGSKQSYKGIMIALIVVLILLIATIVYLMRRRAVRKHKDKF